MVPCEFDYSRRDRLTQLESHKQLVINFLQQHSLTASDHDRRLIEAILEEVSKDSY